MEGRGESKAEIVEESCLWLLNARFIVSTLCCRHWVSVNVARKVVV